MTKQLQYNSLTDQFYIDKENKAIFEMHSKTDFSSDIDYNEFANEIPFVGIILQPFQFELVF